MQAGLDSVAGMAHAGHMHVLTDLFACLRFYSRLPVPVLARESTPHAMPDFTRAIRLLPVAGWIIAAPAGLVLWLAGVLLPAGIAAGLALAVLVATTGAFHEDGLADTADGFGGGRTRDRKLEIMRDSRIGTFGGAALILALLLRWAALAALAQASLPLAVASLIACAGLSRWFGLFPLVLLPPARTDGAAHAAARPHGDAMVFAGILGLAGSLAPCLTGFALLPVLAGDMLACGAALGLVWLSRRQIQGQTGDVAGAAQQLAEIAFLVALCGRV